MSGWLEILLVAFTAQLAVLPGEKVQFIIAGLSTRYHPAIVVGAAGLAFGGWTFVEIQVGGALKNALPEVYLTAFTGGLFLLFAVLLYRSAPPAGVDTPQATETDGGVFESGLREYSLFGYQVSGYLGGFIPIFAMMVAGEFGDKTQLVTIGIAATYGAHPAIWFGEMLAIIPVSIVNSLFFHRYSSRFDARKAHLFGTILFAFFAVDSALSIIFGISVWDTTIEFVTTAILAQVG